MSKHIARLSGAFLLLATLGVAPALAATRVYVQVAPPVVVEESRPRAPHRDWIWRPGHHRWVHHRYEWVHGAWVSPPHRRAAWTPGHWAHDRHGYYWVNGYWSR
jgi:hypothetical protein